MNANKKINIKKPILSPEERSWFSRGTSDDYSKKSKSNENEVSGKSIEDIKYRYESGFISKEEVVKELKSVRDKLDLWINSLNENQNS